MDREKEALKVLPAARDIPPAAALPTLVPQRVGRRTRCHQASTGRATSGIRQQDCHALKCHLLSGLLLEQYQNTLPMAHSREPQKAAEFFASLGKCAPPRPSISKVPRGQRQQSRFFCTTSSEKFGSALLRASSKFNLSVINCQGLFSAGGLLTHCPQAVERQRREADILSSLRHHLNISPKPCLLLLVFLGSPNPQIFLSLLPTF